MQYEDWQGWTDVSFSLKKKKRIYHLFERERDHTLEHGGGGAKRRARISRKLGPERRA